MLLDESDEVGGVEDEKFRPKDWVLPYATINVGRRWNSTIATNTLRPAGQVWAESLMGAICDTECTTKPLEQYAVVDRVEGRR